MEGETPRAEGKLSGPLSATQRRPSSWGPGRGVRDRVGEGGPILPPGPCQPALRVPLWLLFVSLCFGLLKLFSFRSLSFDHFGKIG